MLKKTDTSEKDPNIVLDANTYFYFLLKKQKKKKHNPIFGS